MNRYSLLTTSLLLCSCLAAGADSLNIFWQKAGRYYQLKQYDSAACYFEQIAARKPEAATVYYNLGNTYYRLNKIGLAVLNYERALKRAPDYRDAADNLLLAQSRIPNRIPASREIFFVRWWQALIRPDRAGFWATVSLVLFLTGIFLLLYRRLSRSGRSIPMQVIGVLTVIWLATLFLCWQASSAAVAASRAVVLRNEAPLMSRPAPGAKSVSPVPEGTSVALEEKSGDWVSVTLPDGRSGWMRQDHLRGVD